MATTFKTFMNNDTVSTRTLLHEAIPVTGTIVSGTYADNNIKNFSHGMFQSTYDYPHLSSSANHIFDVTMGYASSSAFSGAANVVQNDKKINVYNQMAQVLAGYDVNGNIRVFDEDGNFAAGGTKVDSCFFINFSRLLSKDEIKKGSFSMTFVTGGYYNGARSGSSARVNNSELTITDTNAQNDFRINSPAGEYAVLRGPSGNSAQPYGLLYYQAGIAVLSSSVFKNNDMRITSTNGGTLPGPYNFYSGALGDYLELSITGAMTGATIQQNCDALRNRMVKFSFNNTTELNSTVYFCRINHNEYNYSSNPTYLSASKIQVKKNTSDSPVSYVTTVGLYSADNELLAVAKLSEPLKKTPENELTLRVRLDY